jgi:hypothetical protein
MRPSRSSFELSTALKTLSDISGGESERDRGQFSGVALVSFGQTAPAQPQAQPPAPAIDPPKQAAPAPPTAPPQPEEINEALKRPPKLPDLSGVISPGVRCERIVEWIIEATGASDVFLADASGLPVAGAIADAEARLAASGLVASSVASLAAAIPGNPSKLFEVHVGEGPFFQLIGFNAGAGLFLVGLNRPTPLTPRQAHAIRLACRHALGEALGGPM